MNVINVGNHLKKWYAFLKLVKYRLVPNARVKIPTRKYLPFFLLGLLVWELQALPPADAGRREALPELDKSCPAVRRFFWRTKRMKIQNIETKENLNHRLKRIEGQVRGVQIMLNEERDCQEIMQQLTAIHSAVQSTSRIFLQDYATACLLEMDKDTHDPSGLPKRNKREKMIREMIQLLDKTP
jgi:DNA-binding FrmR family transcriptional regulator